MLDKLHTGICKDKNIRITPDNKYVSILDIIQLINNSSKNSVSKLWAKINDKINDLKIYSYKFPGPGQKIHHVVNLKI